MKGWKIIKTCLPMEGTMKPLNIETFGYFKDMNAMTLEERMKQRQYLIDSGNTNKMPSSSKLGRVKALTVMKKKIHNFMHSGVEHLELKGQVLKLEQEYIRVKEKRDLIIAIEYILKSPAAGSYTLEEIGRVLGVTRERVRQLEAAAEKILQHPGTARSLREYLYHDRTR